MCNKTTACIVLLLMACNVIVLAGWGASTRVKASAKKAGEAAAAAAQQAATAEEMAATAAALKVQSAAAAAASAGVDTLKFESGKINSTTAAKAANWSHAATPSPANSSTVAGSPRHDSRVASPESNNSMESYGVWCSTWCRSLLQSNPDLNVQLVPRCPGNSCNCTVPHGGAKALQKTPIRPPFGAWDCYCMGTPAAAELLWEAPQVMHLICM